MNIRDTLRKYRLNTDGWHGMAGRWAVFVEYSELQRIRLSLESEDGHFYEPVFLCVQLWIKRDAWVFGPRCLYYDGPHMSFGFGPFALLSWEPWTKRGHAFAMWLEGGAKWSDIARVLR